MIIFRNRLREGAANVKAHLAAEAEFQHCPSRLQAGVADAHGLTLDRVVG
jgi:hypothetical protein